MALTRLGFHFSSTTYDGWTSATLASTVLDVAAAAEQAGFDSLWVPDHAHQNPIGGGPTTPMPEAYALLAALAARTTAVRLGALVSPITFRAPSLLAKAVATLDVLSGGRAVLGLGAAWDTAEHTAYGIDYPPLPERYERLEEALQLCRALLGEQPASFAGRFFTLDGAWCSPPPVQARLPILVGGGGERRTLALVARYADACNFFGGIDDLRRKLQVLRQHCDEAGRDPSEVTTTVAFMAPDDPDEVRRLADERLALGVDGVILFGGSAPSASTVAAWGAALADLHTCWSPPTTSAPTAASSSARPSVGRSPTTSG